MSNEKPIVKDRRAYFSQNNSPFKVRCPECVRTKSLRHCKIYKNLPAVWWHIKQEHGNISNLVFNTNDIIDVLNALDKALQWGMLPDATGTQTTEPNTTTSSSLLYDGRPARKDVLEKMAKIAIVLHEQNFFPFFKSYQLNKIIDEVIFRPDPRTKKKYFECITNHSTKHNIDGVYGVKPFYDLIPSKYLEQVRLHLNLSV